MRKLFFILSLLTAMAQAVAQSPQVIKSGEWTINATDKFATAQRTGQKEKVLIYRETRDSDKRQGEFYNLLSVVGGVVSYHYSYYFEGGAHPSYGSMFKTADLNNKTEQAHIFTFFDEAVLMRALMADSTIRAAMNGMATDKMEEMLDNIDGDCAINFQPLPYSWSINHIEKDTAEVCFGLSHGCEVMRGNFTLIKITVPFKSAVAQAFAEAADLRSTMQYLYTEE